MTNTNMEKPEGWLDEDELREKIRQELTNGVIIDEVSKEIVSEQDQLKALSKAILSLIYLVQDEASGSVKEYITFLLTEFKTLSNQFNDERKFQFFNKENGAMLQFENDGNIQLLMRQEFFEKQFKDLQNRLDAM